MIRHLLFTVAGLIATLLILAPAVLRADPPERLLTGLNDARSIRASTLDHLFLVETGRNRILKITPDGERIDSVGRIGSGDYQFDTPVAIDPTNELKIYVADRNNRRIQVFDRRMQFLTTVMLPQRAGYGLSYRPTMLTVDYAGRLYFFDDDRHLVYRFDSNGQYDLSFELYSQQERIIPVSMVIHDDVLWVMGRNSQLIHRFSSSGSYLGFLYPPETVRAVRKIRNELWVLGDRYLMQLDRSGEILQRYPLPGEDGQPAQSDNPHRWLSFDITKMTAFLLDGQKLVRMPLTPPTDSGTDSNTGAEPPAPSSPPSP